MFMRMSERGEKKREKVGRGGGEKVWRPRGREREREKLTSSPRAINQPILTHPRDKLQDKAKPLKRNAKFGKTNLRKRR